MAVLSPTAMELFLGSNSYHFVYSIYRKKTVYLYSLSLSFYLSLLYLSIYPSIYLSLLYVSVMNLCSTINYVQFFRSPFGSRQNLRENEVSKSKMTIIIILFIIMIIIFMIIIIIIVFIIVVVIIGALV